MWKQCSHSGLHLTVSLLTYSDKQMEHTISLVPGNLLLSPNSIFLYVSIVDSSRPVVVTTTSFGCSVKPAAIAAFCRLREANLLEMQTPIAIQVAKIVAGPNMVRPMILRACNHVL